MNIVQATVLGIVEGITEFLPISSTAHLIVVGQFLGIQQNQFQKFFEVFIQSGAILAVVFLYIQYLLQNKKVIKNVVLSFIPTAVIGLLMYDVIKNVFFESNLLIAFSLVVVGLVFVVIERLIATKKLSLNKEIQNMTGEQAVFIGLLQSLAIIPGVSRAGIIIAGMMTMKYKRSESALYSFLLAMPTILAASLLDLYQSRDLLFSSGSNASLLIVGFATSFVTAFVTVRWLISYLQKNTLEYFAYYRFALAIIVLLFLGL